MFGLLPEKQQIAFILEDELVVTHTFTLIPPLRFLYASNNVAYIHIQTLFMHNLKHSMFAADTFTHNKHLCCLVVKRKQRTGIPDGHPSPYPCLPSSPLLSLLLLLLLHCLYVRLQHLSLKAE